MRFPIPLRATLTGLAAALLVAAPRISAQTEEPLSFSWTEFLVNAEPGIYGCGRDPAGGGWAGATFSESGFRIGAGEDGFGLTCGSNDGGTWAVRPLDLADPLVFHNELHPDLLFKPLAMNLWVSNPACLSVRGILGGEVIPGGCLELGAGINTITSLASVQDSYFWFSLAPLATGCPPICATLTAAKGGPMLFGAGDPFTWGLVDITVEYTLPTTGPGDVVPEPATFTLLATGLAALAARRRKLET